MDFIKKIAISKICKSAKLFLADLKIKIFNAAII